MLEELDLFAPLEYESSQTMTVEEDSVPPLHQGFLWKKSPNPLRIRKYQHRYVELALGLLSWSASKGSVNKGRIDFSKNQCEVLEINGSSTEFEITPVGGRWEEGDFTGIDSGRAVLFDSTDSEHTRSYWIEVIMLHMGYGQKYSLLQQSAEEGQFESSPSDRSFGAMRSLAPLNQVQENGNGSSNSPSRLGDDLPSKSSLSGSWMNMGSFQGDAIEASASMHQVWNNPTEMVRFHLEQINSEDDGGTFPLKLGWDLRVPKPMVPDRSKWRGVFTGAPTEIVEELSGSARYQAAALPLDYRQGEPDPLHAPSTPEHGALRHVMEFINYHIVLQGRPRCFYGGVGTPPAEMRNMQDTQSGLFPGHFECQACFACPHGGNGGVTDLLRNCWNTQAMLNHGGFQWMSLIAGHNGEEFMPFTTPFGLQGVPIPPRKKRAALLKDQEFTKDCGNLSALASSLYTSGHGPYLILYKRPEEHTKEQKLNPSWAWDRAQHQVNQVAPGNTSRVLVYPPPGMIVKGGFQGERIGGRNGLPGEDKMADEAGVSPGSTLGGPSIKVHFFAISDHSKYRGCEDAKLVDLETGEEVPCWVSDCMAEAGDAYHQRSLNDTMGLSAGKVWIIPKPCLSMSRVYECSMKILMNDGPIELNWSWSTFGPRVYEVPGPDPEDTTKSLDWALESVSDMRMKPQMRPDGTPVPNVICIRPGTYYVTARFIDSGAWLHLEGAGVEETTLVVETPEESEIFEFPAEIGPNGLRGQKTGYEYGWQNPDVPLFNMSYNCFRSADHNGGGVDPGGYKQPRRTVTMSGLTLRHNVPIVIGDYGFLELVDCHVIGPTTPTGSPMLTHPSNGPLVRFSEVTHLSSRLFDAADLDGDGRLSIAEFQTTVMNGAGLDTQDATALFNEADTNHRGFLSRREFESAYFVLLTSLEPTVEIYAGATAL